MPPRCGCLARNRWLSLRLDAALVDLAEQSRRREVSDSDWPEVREPVQQRFDDLVDAVRNDLSLPPLEALRSGAGFAQHRRPGLAT